MSTTTKNLTESLVDEITRVTEIKAEYEKIPTGAFAAAFMNADIDAAKKAMGSGDTVGMLLSYQKLKTYTL